MVDRFSRAKNRNDGYLAAEDKTCDMCGRKYDPGWKYCPTCGRFCWACKQYHSPREARCFPRGDETDGK